MKRLVAVVTILLLCLSASAAPRRRAVRKPANAVPETGTPAAWLAANAFPIHSTDLTTDSSDLAPLGGIIGNASIVGLGDGTHGTHEFYTIKLRIIDKLVREHGFDLIAFEGSLPLFDLFDAYVQGGPGDARTLVAQTGGYPFWGSEEIVEVLEWARQYNAHRGSKPPVRIAGADIWDPRGASEAVIAYVRGIDPAAAGAYESDYQCVRQLTSIFPFGCGKEPVEAAYNRLLGRRADLGSGSGASAFENALQNARVAVQSFSPIRARDAGMAENVAWLRQHRSQTRRIVYWAHGEHVGQVVSAQTSAGSAGSFLERDFGSGYVSIGTTTGSGQYMTWTSSGGTAFPVPAPESGTYEAYFQLGTRPAMLVPLRSNTPAWLAAPARYFFAASAPIDPPYLEGSLPLKHDAIIYIHATSPLRLLAP